MTAAAIELRGEAVVLDLTLKAARCRALAASMYLELGLVDEAKSTLDRLAAEAR